jgi:hypothetical protein
MTFIVKCATVTRFIIAYSSTLMEKQEFYCLSSLETVHDTVQHRYCIFFIAQSSLED